MHAFLSPEKGLPLLLIPEYSGINEEQRIHDRSKTAHRKPPVKCFLTFDYCFFCFHLLFCFFVRSEFCLFLFLFSFCKFYISKKLSINSKVPNLYIIFHNSLIIFLFLKHSLFGFNWAFWIWISISLTRFGKFSAIISRNKLFASLHLSLVSSGAPVIHILLCLVKLHKSYKLSSLFFSLLFLLWLDDFQRSVFEFAVSSFLLVESVAESLY